MTAKGLLKPKRNLKTYSYAFLVCIFYPIVKMMDALNLMDKEVDKAWSISILSKTTSFPQYFGENWSNKNSDSFGQFCSDWRRDLPTTNSMLVMSFKPLLFAAGALPLLIINSIFIQHHGKNHLGYQNTDALCIMHYVMICRWRGRQYSLHLLSRLVTINYQSVEII